VYNDFAFEKSGFFDCPEAVAVVDVDGDAMGTAESGAWSEFDGCMGLNALPNVDACPNGLEPETEPNAEVAGVCVGLPYTDVGAGVPKAEVACCAGASKADVVAGAVFPKAEVPEIGPPKAEVGLPNAETVEVFPNADELGTGFPKADVWVFGAG